MMLVVPDLQERGVLAHVGVAHDHVQPAVALGIGMRLVPGIDDRPAAGGGRRDAFPDVLGPLAYAVLSAASRLQDLARPGVNLAGNEERDEHLGIMGEVVPPRRQVVLVAAVGVAGGVGVVLEQEDDAPDALFAQARLGRHDQVLEYALARLVVDDEVADRVTFGGGVLGVAADVEVETGPVFQEHVGRPAPRHHAPEKVARHLVRAQAALAAKGAGNAVLVLQAEDASFHVGALCLPIGRLPRLWGQDCPRARWPVARQTRWGRVIAMSQGLRMVHLRTVPDGWHAKVLAARLGCEGIVTHLQGNVSGPYPFGAVSVLVEEEPGRTGGGVAPG